MVEGARAILPGEEAWENNCDPELHDVILSLIHLHMAIILNPAKTSAKL